MIEKIYWIMHRTLHIVNHVSYTLYQVHNCEWHVLNMFWNFIYIYIHIYVCICIHTSKLYATYYTWCNLYLIWYIINSISYTIYIWYTMFIKHWVYVHVTNYIVCIVYSKSYTMHSVSYTILCHILLCTSMYMYSIWSSSYLYYIIFVFICSV